MQKYQHIFWDLDHTLWDFEKNSVAALEQVYHHFGLKNRGINDFSIFEKTYHIHNDKYWERFRKGFITREEMRWKRMWITLMDYKIVDEKLATDMGEAYLEFLPQQNNVFEYAVDILEYCANKNYQQHIITNGFEQTQFAKMKNANIFHFFDKIITSEKAMAMKPKPQIYHYAFEQTGANASNSLMIGDAVDVDVLGALEVGMDAVWFNPTSLVSNSKRTYECSSLKQLFDIL